VGTIIGLCGIVAAVATARGIAAAAAVLCGIVTTGAAVVLHITVAVSWGWPSCHGRSWRGRAAAHPLARVVVRER
jgi:hypothetical protein